MKILFALFLFIALLSAEAGVPYGIVYSRSPYQGAFVPTFVASNTATLYNLTTNALSGSIVYLSAGSFDLNTPLVIPPGVALSGQGSNATILRNLVRADGAITGRGCGIVPGDYSVIQYLQVTNALAQTNYQGCIGAITPQPMFAEVTTRNLFCRGSSDCYQVNQDTAFNCVWNDYGSTCTSKWDVVVFACNDFNTPATLHFHSYGSVFSSVGPTANGANTAHGFYSQVDFIDAAFEGSTLSVIGNSVNRSWQIDTGLEEGDSTGTFLLKNPTQTGVTVNAATILPTTNTALVSLNGSARDGGNLTNLPAASISAGTASISITGTAAAPTITQTNLISGLVYHNLSGRPQMVIQGAALTEAIVSGASEMSFYVDVNNGTAWGRTNRVTIGTTVSTPADTDVLQLIGSIPIGASYIFTNTSRGAGNSAAPDNSQTTGVLITY